MAKNFLFTGGGTGGHVAPALAIAEGIRKNHPDAHFLYVGVKGKAEESMVPKAWATEISEGQASIQFVRSRGYPGMNLRAIFFVIDLCFGILSSLFILLRVRPEAIVATGGYVSAPILFAAFALKKIGLIRSTIFIHEQNAVLGLMNRVAVRFADKVGAAFPGTKIPKTKKVFVGYPVRGSVVVERNSDKSKLRQQARKNLNIPQDAKVVFAFGGSQGARTINRGLADALPLLLQDPNIYVIHGTGKQLKGNAYNGFEDVQKRLSNMQKDLPADYKERYRPTDFFFNMGENYAAADLVICRGGAGSLYEICANGVAAIAIPKANLPGDHQAANARALERLDVLRVLYERVNLTSGDAVESVDPQELSDLVFSLLENVDLRTEMVQHGQQQYDPKTTQYCADVVDALIHKSNLPELPTEPQQHEERVLGKNSTGLERLLRSDRQGQITLTVEERRIALYKIDGYASQGGLVMPARACRMIGEGRFGERLDVLHYFAQNPKASPFTRRDAFVGLRKLAARDKKSIDVMIAGLQDPYFETVNEALLCFDYIVENYRGEIAEHIEDIKSAVLPFANNESFDIRMHALAALSEIITSKESILPLLQQNYFHPNWKVRQGIMKNFATLMRRGLMTKKEVEEELPNILQTSNGFDMNFRLKREIRSTLQKKDKEVLVERVQSLLSTQENKRSTSLQEIESLRSFAKEKQLSFEVYDALEMLLKNEEQNQKEDIYMKKNTEV
jgi:UDP-N-acetylglucosamine--N-acetylmuramyl-(pentapeptide) pyrophosphoryl-undecaprenol N-acetylglucosamine transferase